MPQEVEKYSKPTRILHWVHLVSFCILFLTGLVLFVPGLGIYSDELEGNQEGNQRSLLLVSR